MRQVDAPSRHLPHVLPQVPGARLIGFVHGDGYRVMIDRQIRISPQGHADSFGGPTSSGGPSGQEPP